ncbi:hypothetical protein ACJJTC_001844 [Scirpophaga incertulas]
MAKSQINIKSSSYLRDKEVFLKELKQFNESKNIPFKHPIVNGMEIDLFHLYSLVQQRGGLSKVNQYDTWESFLRPLRLPNPCVNGSTLLRRLYGTYLEKYERAKGPPGRDDDNDLDDDPRRGRGGGMPRISFASGETIRTGTRVAGPSERLALSLLSPMPNEQDFAVNVCTILAADNSNRLPLSTTPHILDFLLAHAGVYNHSSLRDTIGRSYYEARGRYPDDFWKLRAGGGGAKELADESKFMQPGLEQPELMVQALAAHNALTDCLMQEEPRDDSLEKIIQEDILEDWVTEPSEEDQLFAPELPGGASCVYTQRVLQIASIVRSLSFYEENIQYLAKNTTLIRFLLLCANCWVGSLRQSGLDTLGNVSTELVIKDPATCLISRHVLSTIQSALVSPDRARVLAALELLNKLSQNEVNEEPLSKALEAKVYSDVCALLTLRDIMVLVCTLECVYALTSLGDRASEAVARVPGLVHTLVSLVTVEAQSYGPRACILMRVVETVSGPSALAAVAERETANQNAAHPVPAQQKAPEPVSVSPASPAPPPPPTTTASVSSPPVNSLQQSHMQQRTVQENEHFAQAWLRSSYEPLPPSDNSSCDAAEVYRQYLACCGKLGRKGVIAPAHFPRLVRTVFGGTVGPNTVTTATGESQQAYIGIRPRNVPNRTNPPPGPSSPILKAQLTIKSGGSRSETCRVTGPSPPAQQPATSHPHLSQALETGASNTTLIKHLLAHKVAQRQQSQQRIAPANTVVVQQNTKTAQNKMLADLLEKKSNPPVQVVQMGAQMNPPTIQITETGQIVQVKTESDPLIQINPEPNQYFQIKNDQGHLIQLKNDQGHLIQLKNEQGQIIQLKNEQGQIIQLKNEQGQLIQLKNEQVSSQMMQFKTEPIPIQPKPESHINVQSGQLIQQTVLQALKPEKDTSSETVVTDHAYTEPPLKKSKIEDKRETTSPQESVSKTAANLYAALAASALEDEDLVPPTLQVAQPTLQVQQPTLQVQQPTLQVQAPTLQVQQPTLQVQQPLMQVQPMDVQNILASQSGQIILQEKPITNQPAQFVQQPMQIIATPSTAQGGLSYIAQNIPGNMMQKTIIIVQGPTGGGPLTLTVNNPGGLDEATLNSLIAQATEAITQQQIIQNTPQITPSQQPIITTQPQPHKAQIINQPQTQQIVVTQKQPPGLMNTTSNQIITGNQQIIQNNPQIIQGSQQIIQSNQQMIQSSPQIIQSSSQIIQNNPQIIQSSPQIIQSSPQIIQSNPQIIQSNQQIMQGNQQIIQGNQQIIQGSQQLIQGNQQIIAVSNNQQIIVNTSLKPGIHRVATQPQRTQVVTNVQPTIVNQSPAVAIPNENKLSVIQTNAKAQQPVVRQVITRQPVMMGNTKVGEKELVVTQPVAVTEPPKPTTPKLTATPPPPPQLPINPQEDTPWICHWKGCGKIFTSSSQVFSHAARVHCPPSAGGEAPCMWIDCDRVPRKTFALLNHLTDKHCTANALKAIYNARRQTASDSEHKPVKLGYPPNAALAALNKHANDMFNTRELMQSPDVSRSQDQPDENEGPVTKSIRLTAALILRNIGIYSNTGRRQLRSYESHLSTIALSNVEASRTIAQVLYDMNNI